MTRDTDGTVVEVLLVEDNPDDADLIREAFKEGKSRKHLSVVEDGEEALAFLRHAGRFTDAPRPDLVLLDLNLPKRSGREVLADIKSDPDLKRIPVVVLSTSTHEMDVLHSYNLNAHCYITKPMALNGFLAAVRLIDEFWLTVVQLPPK